MIYVVKHNNDMYIPVDLMSGYKEIKVGKLFEDDGRDNINYLNPYINETTALYDIWKNCTDEYVGLNHYRRLFLVDGTTNVLSFEQAKDYLRNYDLLCTKFHSLQGNSIYGYFKYSLRVTTPSSVPTFEKYMEKLGNVCPECLAYFKKKTEFIGRNMFVARKEVIDEYCKWLFPIIIPLTEEFVENDLEAAKGQERMIGHFVERMFSYWIEEVHGKDKIGGLYYITYGE